MGTWAHTAVAMVAAAVKAEATAVAPEKGRGSAWGPAIVGKFANPMSSAQISALRPDIGTGATGTQAANFISKLAQNKNIYMSIELKHFRELLEFLKHLKSLILKTATTLQSK